MPAESAELKSCCAAVYQSDFARMLLGDSFHPGGLRLTARLGEHLGLGPGVRVLDVASGKGESAIFLARQFGCQVVGVDFGAAECAWRPTPGPRQRRLIILSHSSKATPSAWIFRTRASTRSSASAHSALFPISAPPRLSLHAFCAREVRVGMSDLTRSGPLPQELEGLLAWIACIADARPVEEYAGYLNAAGFDVTTIEPHNNALAEMARDIQGRLLGIELMVKLKKLDLPGADFEQAKQLARAAATAIQQGLLGYSLIVARLRTRELACF